MTKQQQIGDFLEPAVLRQITDRITTIEETGFPFIDEAESRFTGDHSFETGAISGTVFRLSRGRLIHHPAHRSSLLNAHESPYTGADCTVLVVSSCDGASPSEIQPASARPTAYRRLARPS